jgi:hypothetical protein
MTVRSSSTFTVILRAEPGTDGVRALRALLKLHYGPTGSARSLSNKPRQQDRTPKENGRAIGPTLPLVCVVCRIGPPTPLEIGGYHF